MVGHILLICLNLVIATSFFFMAMHQKPEKNKRVNDKAFWLLVGAIVFYIWTLLLADSLRDLML